MTVDFFQLVNAEMLYTQPPPLYTGQVPCWSFLGQALDLSVYFPAVFLFQRNILAYVLGFIWQNQLPQLERGVDMCQVSTGGRPTASIFLSSFIPYGQETGSLGSWSHIDCWSCITPDFGSRALQSGLW